ncbi:MAG: glycosyltransferase [bacterium]|nr:glycosyltransferase [bacterium]
MKLLFLTHNYPLYEGDIRGRFFQPLIEGLLKNGIEVVVSTPFWESEYDSGTEVLESIADERVVRFLWEGARLQALSPWRIKDLVNFTGFCRAWFRSTGKIIKNEGNFDFVLAAWAIPAGLLFFNKAFRDIRKGVWFLGTDFNRFMQFPFNKVLQGIVSRSDEVWANSKGMAEAVSAKLDRKTSFLPLIAGRPGCDTIPIRMDVPKGNTLRLLSIGRLESVKGFDLSVEASLRLAEQGVDIEYEIIGDGPLREKLNRMIAGKTEKIRLLGKVDDETLLNHLANCDAVIIPSRSEGMPLVFFEALEAGKMVIGTDVGDLGYCLRGSTLGRVTPVGDVEGLAESMRMIVSGNFKYDRLAAEKIMNEYSIKSSVNKIKKAMTK